MTEWITLVNEADEITGYEEKMKTHVEERLHRAFSLFLFNWEDKKLLIHRRAEGKYHSGGLWTNTCCSHPRKGEELSDAVVRRMGDELGLSFEWDVLQPPADMAPYGQLEELGKFRYYARFEHCAESEIDHVYYLPVKEKSIRLCPDPEEMSECKWVSMEALDQWMAEKPQDFTVWFPQALKFFRERIGQMDE